MKAPPLTWTVWPVIWRAKAVAVALTAAGHEVIERSVEAVLGRDSALVAGLSAEEREVLVPLLGKLEAFVRARSA